MSDLTVQLIKGERGEIKPDRSEALRYMGYKGHTPDSSAQTLIDECERELLSAISPLCCYAYSEVSFPCEGVVDIGFGEIESRDLSSHLKGCHGAYLFAATIGIGADRLIAKYNRLKPAKSVIIDALGSAAAENWCDLAELAITSGVKHCSRFSAGYGDFSLAHQVDFMRCLDMQRQLGITLSDSLLMTPTKSVTAVIGIGAETRTCGSKCSVCKNIQCIYRDDKK